MQRTLLLALVLACASPAINAAIAVDTALPSLTIQKDGECVLEGDDTAFVPWSTDKLAGKVQVIEYLAARAGIDQYHADFFKALKAAGLSEDVVPVTTIVNADDALWGTSGLVVGEIEKNKRQNPKAILVVDAEGLGQQKWDLQKKTAALVVVDASGKVLYFDEGEMPAEEVSRAVDLISAQL